MITCETCGELLPDGTQFCSRCGAHVGNPAPTEPIEVPMDTPYPETPPAPDTNPYMQSNDTAYSQQQTYQQPVYQQPASPPQPPYQDPYAQSAGQQQQAYGQYGQQPYYPQPQPNKTDGKAVVSLILGILSISTSCSYGFGLIFGIPGLLLAMLSRKSTQQQQPYGTPNSGNSAGLATAGMICSVIGTVLSAIMLIILIILFALGMASEVLE
ncbi:DUF4190 domain-containing protein [uncultured Ruminococcus sp.]|uniref:DUF4190 domain-containing protein n=1 Tax=uncultured Ruminococcus sp. TaxID=165186 RepID=UPI00265F5AB0|nr:DUF4190 domain-containing protein [uncultured Ruminococcus sp.]